MNKKRLECEIFGRVQLVMFRDFAARAAKKLGLMGVVWNEKSGSVRVLAEGDEENLKVLLEKLKKGPIAARVDRVEEKWGEASGAFNNFTIDFYGDRR